jgi:hypothetical protein
VTIRVFVNAVALDAAEGSTALDCIRAWREEEADAVNAGMRVITDSRGLPMPGDSPARAGSIYRTISRRGTASAE